MQDEAIRVADLPDRFLSADRDGMHDGAVPQQVVGVNGLVHAGQRGFRRERYEDLAVERLRNGGFLDCADRFVAGQHRRRFAPFRRGFVFRNGRDRVIPLSMVQLSRTMVGRGCSPSMGVRPSSSVRSPSSAGLNALLPARADSHSWSIRSPHGVHNCCSGSRERIFVGAAFSTRLISSMESPFLQLCTSLRFIVLSGLRFLTIRTAV